MEGEKGTKYNLQVFFSFLPVYCSLVLYSVLPRGGACLEYRRHITVQYGYQGTTQGTSSPRSLHCTLTLHAAKRIEFHMIALLLQDWPLLFLAWCYCFLLQSCCGGQSQYHTASVRKGER
ncbi:hypothetical protein V8F20_012271 [Naviculisporaceae sp. PSN 640]